MLDPATYVLDRMGDGLTFDEACREYRRAVARYVETLRDNKGDV